MLLGEDVVAGVRTPMHITEMEQKFPEAFVQFKQVCKTLEDHYRDMQDMEFTVEHGKLYMLQTRVKATPVPQSSPMLPNAIICTLTAVPQEYGISLSRR